MFKLIKSLRKKHTKKVKSRARPGWSREELNLTDTKKKSRDQKHMSVMTRNF